MKRMRNLSLAFAFCVVVVAVSLFLYERFHRECPECVAQRQHQTGARKIVADTQDGFVPVASPTAEVEEELLEEDS